MIAIAARMLPFKNIFCATGGTCFGFPLVALALFGCLSCASSTKMIEVSGAQGEIDDVFLEGVERFEKEELLSYLHICETSWSPFSEPCLFNEAHIPIDSQRIEALYHAHGYFEAKVVEIRPLDKQGRGDEVDVAIVVEEGQRVTIESVAYSWDFDSSAATKSTVDENAVESESLITGGDPLEIGALDEAASRMRHALAKRGYPRSRVTHHEIVDLEYHKAQVRFSLSTGPRATIGAIEIVGLNMVPEYLVRREIDFAPGKAFSPGLVDRVEKAVFAMDVFSAVSVSAEGDVAADGTIALTVAVIETEPQLVKIGVGLGLEPTRWEERATAQYTHNDLFGHLTRFDLRLKAGYVELPNLFSPKEHGPVVKIAPRLRKKGWIEKRLVMTMAPAFDLGIEEGYRYYSPSTRIAVSRFFFERLHAELGHNIKYVDFFSVSPVLDANKSLLGLDFRDPYLLSWIDVALSLHFTDRILDPRNGLVLEVRYAIAGGILGGDYDFQKVVPSARVYWQVFSRLQLALKAETGMIFPFGDQPSAPFDNKFYLGGGDTVRGWGLRHLSPRTVLCSSSGDCSRLPIGGYTMVLGSGELRLRTVGPLYVAAFVDAGDVREGESEYDLSELNYSAGGGLRYASPFGKIRFDVGFRLNDTPLSEGEDRWAFHIGLGEVF